MPAQVNTQDVMGFAQAGFFDELRPTRHVAGGAVDQHQWRLRTPLPCSVPAPVYESRAVRGDEGVLGFHGRDAGLNNSQRDYFRLGGGLPNVELRAVTQRGARRAA